MWKQACWAAAGSTLALGAHADDTPKPDPSDHPDSTWSARALAGYSKTGGTTDTSAANALFHVAHVMGNWKVLLGFEGVYGSTDGETTAEAWHARLQGDYNFSTRFYWYGAYRYDDDRFSGFAYQQVASTGLGYNIVKTDATKLTVQAGVGRRALRPELLTLDAVGGIVSSTELERETDTVLDAALMFEHSFNAATKLTANAAIDEGDLNTMTSYNVALQVKMTSQLALSAGYSVVRNSKPPPGAVPNAILTTLNLVYEFKNSKLPPD
jgi:putative salt-induced outer membrane protein